MIPEGEAVKLTAHDSPEPKYSIESIVNQISRKLKWRIETARFGEDFHFLLFLRLQSELYTGFYIKFPIIYCFTNTFMLIINFHIIWASVKSEERNLNLLYT